jgi:membrane protein
MGFFRLLRYATGRLFDDGGFSLAAAMAFSTILALFPFFVFVGALAGFLGGPELAKVAVQTAAAYLPREVASAIEPQIISVLTTERVDLLTIGGLTTLFFASNGIESLRWALNLAYDVEERRSVIWQRFQSIILVILSAFIVLFLALSVVNLPELTKVLGPKVASFMTQAVLSQKLQFSIALMLACILLYGLHAWLPAGIRKLREIWPGIVLTIVLSVICIVGFSYYLVYSDYGAIYAGMAQAVIVLMFFYFISAIIIFGAEFNRAIQAHANGDG